MDIKAKYKEIKVYETIFSEVVEKSVEMDYLLADYCPNIYKVLRCHINPVITSRRVESGKLIIDLCAVIKVLYITEESKKIHCIEQKQMYTKEIEIKDLNDSCNISLAAKCDYKNLRVVNPRRVELKGAISIKVVVTKPSSTRIIDQVTQDNCYVKSSNNVICSDIPCFTKDATITEDVELALGKPSIAGILSNSACATVNDYKIMKDKALIKGNVNIHILYTADKTEKSGDSDDDISDNNVLEYTIPFSQIIDMAGIEEDHKLLINVDVHPIEIDYSKLSDENKVITLSIPMFFECMAAKNVKSELIEDLYSTDYECDIEKQRIKASTYVECINTSFVTKNNLQLPNTNISGVCDVTSEVCLPTCKFTADNILVMFNNQICVIVYDESGVPAQFEKTIPCEVQLPNNANSEDIIFTPTLTVTGCGFTLLSENQIEVRTDVTINGVLYRICYCDGVSSAKLLEDMPKAVQDNGAICLYYAEAGEDVWEIAKQFNTGADAILTENNIDDSVIKSKQMIFIPMKR